MTVFSRCCAARHGVEVERGFSPGGRLPEGGLFLRLPFRALTGSGFATGADVLAR